MKQIRIALLALAAAIAAGFGSWFLSNSLPAPAVESAQNVPAPRADSPATANPDATSVESAQAATPSIEPPPPAEPQPDPQAVAALEDKLRQAADYQTFFDKLRDVFPAVYKSATNTGAAQAMASQDNAADLFLAEAVRQLRLKRGLLGAKAGTQALDHLFDLHLAVMQKLAASDAALCVDFLNGAPADTFVAFTAANRALMAESSLAGLLAIDDGAQKKIDRDAPSTQDFDDLEKALGEKGLDKPAIALLLDGKTPNPPLDDAQTCQNGITYLETLKSLPEPLRTRLYALALEVTAQE